VVGLGCDNGGLFVLVGGRDGGVLMDQVDSVDVNIQVVVGGKFVFLGNGRGGKVKLNGGSNLTPDDQSNMLDLFERGSPVSM